MALGATPVAIARLVARGALVPTLMGVALGAILSTFTTGLLRDQLFGVAPHDPATVVVIVLLLVGVSLLAAFVPTRRAMRMSATKALAA
jgi:putative ABC transport system permease protein